MHTTLSVQPASAALTGVLLAGGESRRLGRDKTALRLFGADGPSLLLRNAGLLAELAAQVLISCRPGTERHTDAYSVVHDEFPDSGPAGGIHAALKRCNGPVLALSCDLPFMNRETLEHLVAWREQRPEGTLMSTFIRTENGNIEPLVAVYELPALPGFEQALALGERALHRIIAPGFRHCLPYGPNEERAFFNINTPTELETARALINVRAAQEPHDAPAAR